MAATGTYFTCDSVPGWLSKGTDSNGVVWKMTSLTGWDEPPDSRENYVSRVGDGAFDPLIFDDTRVVTWMGLLLAPTRELRQAAKLTLTQLAAALKTGSDLTGHDEDGDRLVHGYRSPGWKVAPFGPLGLQYQAVVRCADPYKYGPELSAATGLPTAGTGGLTFPLFKPSGWLSWGTAGLSGQVTLTNAGTEAAWPTFTVTGPVLGGFSITDISTGRQIAYSDDVPDSGVVLIIDAAAGSASLNGADRTGRLTVKQWFPCPADGSLTVQFATSGVAGQAGTLTAAMRPTYQ